MKGKEDDAWQYQERDHWDQETVSDQERLQTRQDKKKQINN